MRPLFLSTAVAILFFSCGSVGKLSDDKKSKKEEVKKEKIEQVKELLDSGNYVFEAINAMGQGTSMINVSGNRYVLEIIGDSASAHLPFYGRSYMSMNMGFDGGVKFDTKLEEVKTSKNDKKKTFVLEAVARKGMVTYNFMLEVFENGNAALNINPSNSSTMSYNGEIVPLKKEKE